MPLKSPQPKLLLGIATLAVALSSSSAMAGTPDRTATALWGPSSMVWLTEKPARLASAEAPTPDAAPRTTVQGETISGPGHKIKWCPKKRQCFKGMQSAQEQAMAANAPLHARLETLRQEVKQIWTAKTFDRDAFLKKRAEIRDVHNQMMQNNDTAAANAGMQMSTEQRAHAMPPCWFEKHHSWYNKKMQMRHGGAAKKHHAAAKAEPATGAQNAKPAATGTAVPAESKKEDSPEEKK